MPQEQLPPQQPQTVPDPDVIMKEIIQKDMQNQLKEQELAQKEQNLAMLEQQLKQMAEQSQAQEMAEAQANQQSAQEQPIPVAPTDQQPIPPGPAQPQQQQSPDVSEEIAQNLQPGMSVTVTKKLAVGQDGPMLVSKTENIAPAKAGFGGQQ